MDCRCGSEMCSICNGELMKEWEDRMEELVVVDIMRGPEGPSLYVDSYRVAGKKPWGGGTIIESFKVRRRELLKAADWRN